jgi:signal transduction histidine kinase
MIKQILNSLSARLLGVFLITALLYGSGAYLAVSFVLDRDDLRLTVGPHVSFYIDLVLQEVGDPPNIERAQAIVERIPADLKITGPDVDWASDPNFPSDEALASGAVELGGGDGVDERIWGEALTNADYFNHEGHRYVRLVQGDYRVTLVSPKVAKQVDNVDTRPLLVAFALVLLAGCYFAVQRQVRPIQWIRKGAARVGAGDLGFRINSRRKDDLGDLARDIDRMADDVTQMLEAKRQMLLAISHELRSPLTRTKVALEFVEDEKIREDIAGDIGEMEQLIADLLETERLNTKHRALNLTSVDPTKLVHQTIDEYLSADAGRIQLEMAAGAAHCQWDEARVKLALKNLIENALCHSPDDRMVDVRVSAAGSDLRFAVQDYGCGIADADLAHVTEPFYRADPSRQRDTGGFGLGLYLARLVAEAHGGDLLLASQVGEGTTVTLVLPQQAAGWSHDKLG